MAPRTEEGRVGITQSVSEAPRTPRNQLQRRWLAGRLRGTQSLIGSLVASLRTSKGTLLRTPTSKKLRHWIERPNTEARNLKTNLLPNSPRRVRTEHSTASASRLLPPAHPTKGTGVVKNVLSPNTGEARRQNMPMFRDDCVHHHLEYCLSQDPPQNGRGLTKLFLFECQPNRSAKTFHFTNGEAVAPPSFRLLVNISPLPLSVQPSPRREPIHNAFECPFFQR